MPPPIRIVKREQINRWINSIKIRTPEWNYLTVLLINDRLLLSYYRSLSSKLNYPIYNLSAGLISDIGGMHKNIKILRASHFIEVLWKWYICKFTTIMRGATQSLDTQRVEIDLSLHSPQWQLVNRRVPQQFGTFLKYLVISVIVAPRFCWSVWWSSVGFSQVAAPGRRRILLTMYPTWERRWL